MDMFMANYDYNQTPTQNKNQNHMHNRNPAANPNPNPNPARFNNTQGVDAIDILSMLDQGGSNALGLQGFHTSNFPGGFYSF